MDNIEKINEGLKTLEDAVVFVGSKREQVFSEFVMVFYEAMDVILREKRVTLTDIRVLFGICQLAKFGNMISMSQGKLGEILGLKKQAISRSVISLTNENILIKSEFGLFLNPTLLIKGGLRKITPEQWDASLSVGFESPLKTIQKSQRKRKAIINRAEAREVEAVDIVDEEIETGL